MAQEQLRQKARRGNHEPIGRYHLVHHDFQGIDLIWVKFGEETMCPTCTKVMSQGSLVVKLACLHRFHLTCVEEHFHESCVCPFCGRNARYVYAEQSSRERLKPYLTPSDSDDESITEWCSEICYRSSSWHL